MAAADQLNARPPRLETDDDLLRDQRNFFRAAGVLPETDSPEHEQTEIDLQSLSRPSATPTSAILEPVAERKVSRRSRRRPRPVASKQAFPSPSSVAADQQSAFARHAAKEKHPSQQSRTSEFSGPAAGPPSAVGISDEVKATVAAMSLEDIRAAQQEIYANLRPESVEFLQQRWQQRQSQRPAAPQLIPGNEPTATATLTDAAALPSTNSDQCADEGGNDAKALDFRSKPLAVLEAKSALEERHHGPSQQEIRSELLVPEKGEESDAGEREKRQWMTDASEPLEAQRSVDTLLQQAVRKMGSVGSLRFDLDGHILTAEEVESLPTHLGLHHHGAAPASAGYTLPDILVLTRSTVVTQRVMALRILMATITRHGDKVVRPLLESGGLAVTLAPFPATDAFHTAVSNQIAYVESMETLLGEEAVLPSDQLVEGLYFASNLYSPPRPQQASLLFSTLAESAAVATLSTIAKAHVVRQDGASVAKRALNVMRTIIVLAPVASERIVAESDTTLGILQQVAVTSAGRDSEVFMLVCDIVAQIVATSGWTSDEVQTRFGQTILNDDFLEKLLCHHRWLYVDDRKQVTPSHLLAARGLIRILRAALTFQKGIRLFTRSAPAICGLVHEDSETATEAFLGLESFVHSLFMRTASDRSDSSDQNVNHENVAPDARSQDGDTLEFARHQTSLLTPTALSAVSLATSTRRDATDEARAAAGHFAATLSATVGLRLDEGALAKILNICAYCTRAMDAAEVETRQDLRRFQVLASLDHAAARLLSTVKLEDGFVNRELQILLRSATKEKEVLDNERFEDQYRPVANACAEWACIQSRLGNGLRGAQAAVRILPCLGDARVVLDLLTRTILSEQTLLQMYPEAPPETARNCGNEFLPATMDYFASSTASQERTLQGQATETPAGFPGSGVLLTMDSLCELWVRTFETPESLLCLFGALHRRGLVSSSTLFNVLLRIPPSKYAESLFRFLFAVGKDCISARNRLFESAHMTQISSLSTTVDSPLSEGILSLCEHLVSRGPSVPKVVHEAESSDPLASVLFTLMFGIDVHVSLRSSLWRRTVDDCGGGALYQCAEDFGEQRSTSNLEFQESEEMLGLYGASLARGLLDGARCPASLQTVLLRRINLRVETRGVVDTLRALVPSGSSSAETAVLNSLMQMVDPSTGTAPTAIATWIEKSPSKLV